MDKVWDKGNKGYSLKKFSGKGRENQARQHIKKQRHYFANKGPSSQSFGFSSIRDIIYEYESWTIKKAERWRIDAFKL